MAKFVCLVYVAVVGQVFSPQMEFSARVVETRVSGYPLSMRLVLNCEIAVLNEILLSRQ